MPEQPMNELTITLEVPPDEMNDKELSRLTDDFVQGIRKLRDVEDAGLVEDETLAPGARSVFGAALGAVWAKVGTDGLRRILVFLRDRLAHRDKIKLEVRWTGKTKVVKLEAGDLNDVEAILDRVAKLTA